LVISKEATQITSTNMRIPSPASNRCVLVALAIFITATAFANISNRIHIIYASFSHHLRNQQQGGRMENRLGAALSPMKPTSRECEYTSLLQPAAPYMHISEKIHKNGEPQGRPTTLAGPGSLFIHVNGYVQSSAR